MKFTSVLSLALTTITIIVPIKVQAQSSLENRAVQYSLARLGFYSSTIDGQMGPGTSQAIQNYAAQNDVANSFSDVFVHLAETRLPWQIEWSSQIDEAVMSALQTGLRDFESAQFSGVNMAHQSEDGRWLSACIDVNARNGFGGYTGFQWVYLKGLRQPLGNTEIVNFFMEDLTDYQATYLCRLGFVQELD